jgi:regulator of replication initiation timing
LNIEESNRRRNDLEDQIATANRQRDEARTLNVKLMERNLALIAECDRARDALADMETARDVYKVEAAKTRAALTAVQVEREAALQRVGKELVAERSAHNATKLRLNEAVRLAKDARGILVDACRLHDADCGCGWCIVARVIDALPTDGDPLAEVREFLFAFDQGGCTIDVTDALRRLLAAHPVTEKENGNG